MEGQVHPTMARSATEPSADLLSRGRVSAHEAQRILAVERFQQNAPTMDVGRELAKAAGYESTDHMLQGHLKSSSRKDVLGIHGLLQSVRRERQWRASDDFVHSCPLVASIVHSQRFELLVAAIICVNGVLMGFQTSASGADDGASVYSTLEQVFTAIFVAEIVLRLLADGWVWLCNLMNLGDLLLVLVAGVVPTWFLQPLGVTGDNFRILQVLRTLRLVRLIRLVRTHPYLRMFWQLIRGVIECWTTLFWALTVLSSVLFILAIFGVYFIGRAEHLREDALAQKYFRDTPRAFLTLFVVATLDSWAQGVARPLQTKSWFILPFVSFVIMVVGMVLSNLITGVIVHNAFVKEQQDEELQVRKKTEAARAEAEKLGEIFLEINTDGSGMLSKEEFSSAVEGNALVQQTLTILGITAGETNDIWELIDTGIGQVSMEEFTQTLYAMKGEAKSKDSYSIVQRLRKANDRMSRLSARLRMQKKDVELLRREVIRVDIELSGVLRQVREFVALVGSCIPEAPVPQQEGSLDAFQSSISAQSTAVQLASRDVAGGYPSRTVTASSHPLVAAAMVFP